MSIGDILQDGGEIFIVLASIYIAYRGVKLRGVLVDPPYRRRALWAAIGAFTAIGFLSAALVDTVFPATNLEGVLVQGVTWGFVFLVLFGWVATNIDVALAADYFNRDVLAWRGGGRIAAIAVLVITYVAASLPPWWIPAADQGPGTTVITLAFLAVSAYSAAVLAVTVRRIVDRTIRNYTKWVVISIVLLFWGIFTTGTGDLGDLVGGVFLISWVFSMNHTVTTLAIRTRALPA